MAEGSTGERLLRSGVREMPPELALAALRQALAGDEPCVAVADVDWERFAPSFSAARRRPLIEDIPEAARALTLDHHADGQPTDGPGAGPPSAGPAAAGTFAGAGTSAEPEPEPALVRRLAGLGDDERRRTLVDVVRTEVAAVLGHDGPAAVQPDQALKEMGLDSVTGVELRNQLSRLTGLRLPATLVYDHPTTGALARELSDRLAPLRTSPTDEALDHLARVEAALSSLATDEQALAAVQVSLRRLLSKATGPDAAGGHGRGDNGRDASRQIEEAIQAADDDELLRFIDRELGNPGH
jgi:acyl carrier protein